MLSSFVKNTMELGLFCGLSMGLIPLSKDWFGAAPTSPTSEFVICDIAVIPNSVEWTSLRLGVVGSMN